MDDERLELALLSDETLAALIAHGTPRAPLLELARRVYHEALELLASEQRQAALLRSIELAEAAIAEVEAQRRRLKVEQPRIACARGCASCCILRVEIGALEAERLRPVVEALELSAAVEALASEVGSLSRLERLEARRSCALLGRDGECRVHAVRPMACRAANSMSSDACRRAAQLGDSSVGIPVEGTSFGLMRSAALGLSLACADAGLDASQTELHTALRRGIR
ncbi:MAG TPA: YkgJ family cysteine cluster protein [Polyangiaceae bacterium]|nr:YkgJ family cysteine cluster protein [Polyangiaceae bacterium]